MYFTITKKADVQSQFGFSQVTFTTKEHIHKLYNNGLFIHVIELPTDSELIPNETNPIQSSDASTLIFGKNYSLLDPLTYQELDLKVDPNYASRNGNDQLLDVWKESGMEIEATNDAINNASAKGYINVMDWWRDSQLELKYTEWAVDWATRFGHVSMLDWWLNSGLQLKYSEDALYSASSTGNVVMLDWWLSSELQLRYTEAAMDAASANNHINILNRWLLSKLSLKYTQAAMDDASTHGHIDVLDWWLKSELQLKYTETAMDTASQYGKIAVLDWWLSSGLELKYSEKSMDEASVHEEPVYEEIIEDLPTPVNLNQASDNINNSIDDRTNMIRSWNSDDIIEMSNALPVGKMRYTREIKSDKLKVLKWWKNSQLPLKYSEKAMDIASTRGDIDILNWWMSSQLPLKYSNDGIDCASQLGLTDILDWWKNSHLEMKYSTYALHAPSIYGNISVLDWWKKSNLELKYRKLVYLIPNSDVLYWWWIKSELAPAPMRYIATMIYKIANYLRGPNISTNQSGYVPMVMPVPQTFPDNTEAILVDSCNSL